MSTVKLVRWKVGRAVDKSGAVHPNTPEVRFMFTLQDTEKVQLTVALTDAVGEPVNHTIDFTTDGAVGVLGQPVATVVTDATGTWLMSGEVGVTTITATEVDPTDNVGVTATLDVEVVGSNATTLQITPGTPVLK